MAQQTVVPDDVLKLLELQNFFLLMPRPKKKTNAHIEAVKRVREFGRAIKTVESSSKYYSYLPGPEIIEFCKKLHHDVEKLLK